MGKSRARRFKAPGFTPTAAVTRPMEPEEPGEEEEEQETEDLLLKLQNPCPEVREFACASISKLVEQKQVIPALLQRDAIRCLGPLLLDKCLSVRETAAGALRNLSTCGGFEVCDDMVTRDIMTPLVALLRECSTGLDSDMEQSIKSKDSNKNNVEDIANQAMNVLWNVCESNTKALSVFNKERCVDIVLQCLSKFQSNMELAISAAYCLQTVTEDNSDLLASFGSSALQTLESMLLTPAATMDMRLLQTLIAGTVWNVKERVPPSSQAASINAILKILAEVLSLDAAQFVVQMKEAESLRLSAAASEAEAQEAAAILEDVALSEDNMVEGELKKRSVTGFSEFSPVSKEEFLQASHLLVAQKSALEVIVNMCCSDEPSDDEWEELSSSDESELCLEKGMNDGGGQLMSPLCLSAEIHSALLNHCIPKKVLEKTHFPGADALQTCRKTAEWKPLIQKMYSVQHRALTCLHNILSMLDSESLGGESALQELSLHVSQLLVTGTDVPKRDEFLEAVSGTVRALLQTMASKGIPQCMSPEQVMAFCEACICSSNTSTRVNAVSIIGIAGSVLARSPDTASTLKKIGNLLLGISANDSSLVVSGGALDALFDVFADGEEAEKAAVEINLLQALKKIQPAFKSKMRKEGKEKYSTDQLCVLDNVRTNLRRFISYLESVKRK